MANKQSALSVQKILKMKASGEKIAMATAKPQVFAERIAQKFGFAPKTRRGST